MKILIAEAEEYSPLALQTYRQSGTIVELAPSQELTDQDLSSIDVLVVRLKYQISENVLQAAPQLKYIISPTTGTDHIDLEAAKKRGITVLSLKGETDFLQTIPSTAEFTWGLLLSLVRNIPAACRDVNEGNWDRQRFKGINLQGKKIGILGLGRVGKQVARYAAAFGMHTYAHDPFQKVWMDGVERVGTADELFAQSDVLIISISAFNNDQFIAKPLLTKTRKGTFIINTSRGSVWNENDVMDLLLSAHLGGIATDVITNETEPLIRKQSPILAYAGKLQNLIVTPHLGGATYESMHLTEEFLAKKFYQLKKSEPICVESAE